MSAPADWTRAGIRGNERLMTASTARRSGAAFAILAVLVLLFAGRLVDTAARKSFTFDEPHYVGTGWRLWHGGEYRWMGALRGHPPLAFHLASLPLLVRDPTPILAGPEPGFALLKRPAAEREAVKRLSRLPFIVLACWGAVLLFLWAREVAGNGAAVFAAFLYTFSPGILANAPLAHSDITVTVCYLQALYAFWCWRARPSPTRFALCGVALGLALLAKLSGLLLLPTFALLLLIQVRQPPAAPGTSAPSTPARLAWIAGVLGGWIIIASAVLWVGYGGSFATTPEPSEPFADVPLPGYLRALLFDVEANAAGRRLFFLGRFSDVGPWYALPVAFVLKAPVAVLALLGLALVPGRRALVAPGVEDRDRGRVTLLVAVTAAVYGAAACFWLQVPLGVRYLLPLYPLLFLVIAIRLRDATGAGRRVLAGALCLWLAIASLRIHPDYLAHFSELVGGAREGHRYLLESNLDWGQDLTTLARFLAARGNPPVHLAYFGRENPAAHGIRVAGLAGCAPVSGLVAVSANVLQGLYAPRITDPPVPGCYDWLRRQAPIARPGYSIFVYDIPARGP
jgi:hypothetical protein